MKKLSFLMLSTVLFASACGSSETKELAKKIEVKAENIVVSDYAISGMVCAMGCAKTIEDDIAAIPGVTASSVDFESGKAHFEYDKTQLSEKDIIAKIESLADGQYKVSEWKEKAAADENIEPKSSEETNSATESKTSVKIGLPSFQIPNLFTFLINRV